MAKSDQQRPEPGGNQGTSWVDFSAEDELALDDLVLQFRSIIPLIQQSANSGGTQLYVEHVTQACRLSRRIRLCIGNPYEVSNDKRNRIVDLFEQGAQAIKTDLPEGSDLNEYVANCKNNICDRANFLLHPEKLEEQLAMQ